MYNSIVSLKAELRLRLISAYGGWLRPEQLLQAYDARQLITPTQRGLGRRVWFAFCSPSPKALSQLLTTDLRVLPEIRDTITLMLQEYPERQSGLSRLERKLMRTVDSLGVTTPAATVDTTLHTELVGDVLLFDMLRALLWHRIRCSPFAESFKGKIKSYQFNGSKIEATDTGRSVLTGKADHITLNGIDRWIGGVHLLGHWVRWRWDERSREVVSQHKRASN